MSPTRHRECSRLNAIALNTRRVFAGLEMALTL
jgi:hypothetical protein